MGLFSIFVTGSLACAQEDFFAMSIGGRLPDYKKLDLDLTRHRDLAVIQHSTNWIASGQLSFLGTTILNLILPLSLVLNQRPVI